MPLLWMVVGPMLVLQVQPWDVGGKWYVGLVWRGRGLMLGVAGLYILWDGVWKGAVGQGAGLESDR